MTEAFNRKVRKYEDYKVQTGHTVVPFVMSHWGVVAAETRKLVDEWKRFSVAPGFVSDLYSNAQFALIRAQYQFHRFMKMNREKSFLEMIARLVKGKDKGEE